MRDRDQHSGPPIRRSAGRLEPAPGPVRALLTTAAVALVAMLLLRWSFLAVYRIPSPSMQPLLLGNDAADAHDRVLVDAFAYCRAEPKRWQVIAFRSPLQSRQPVAKRCIGLPGERLRIAGGNVHLLGDDASGPMHVLRKPEAVQEQLWREVHPLRQLARGEPRALGGSLVAAPPAAWGETDDGALTVDATDALERTLAFADPDGGLVDLSWDGCPPATARILRERDATAAQATELVPDAKIAFRMHTAAAPHRLAVEWTVRRPGHDVLRYVLVCEAGSAHLRVDGGDGTPVAATSPPFPLPLLDSEPAEIAFAHVDDELLAWRNGEVVGRLDTARWPCLDGLPLRGAPPSVDHRVELVLRVAPAAPIRFDELRIWRDVHYTPGDLPPDHVITVPAANYFVLGDNPPQSEDSRGFRAVELEVVGDVLVPPGTPGAHVLRGALCLGDGGRPPLPEENPVLVPATGELLFVDDSGQPRTLRFDGPISAHFGSLHFGDPGFEPRATSVAFVGRDRLLGRVVARIWPLPPFGPWRLGWLQ